MVETKSINYLCTATTVEEHLMQGPPRGGAGGYNDPGAHGLQEGRWLQRAHEFERGPSKCFFGEHPISSRKTARISVKTFFFGDYIIIRTKLLHFLRLFWSSQNRKSVIFELAPGPRSALSAPDLV